MVIPKAVYRFNAIPIRILKVFFTEWEQRFLKFVLKHKSPKQQKQKIQRAKTILRKTNRARGITFPDFSLYDKAPVIKRA